VSKDLNSKTFLGGDSKSHYKFQKRSFYCLVFLKRKLPRVMNKRFINFQIVTEIMGEATAKIIKERNTFPLRILGKQGEKYLACPYELKYDNLDVTLLNGNPKIVHFQVVSTDGNPGFKRHFLYSRAEQKHLVTSSGYLFSGKVGVYSSKARGFQDDITDNERDAIAILPLVELLHVHGDEKNETGGLDGAVAEHMKRIDGLKVDNLTLNEAMEFYDAMRYNVPKY